MEKQFGVYREMRTLRDYQQQLREAVHKQFETHNRALVVAATGAGKSGTFAAICADYAPKRALVLVDQFDLVDQTVRAFVDFTGIYADIEQADRRASDKTQVVVATVQTMKNRIADGKYQPSDFGIIVADECDRAMAPQWQEVLNYFDAHANVLGVTATPKRSDKKLVLDYFEQTVFEINTLELIERKYLAPITVRTVPLEINLREVSDRIGEYDAEQLGHAVEAVFDDVCKSILKLARDRKVLVFLPNISTSKAFAIAAVNHGIDARHIDGECGDREEIKQWFRDRKPGELRLLCNPMLLGRGYDDPAIDCVINLRATKSESLFRQIIGRGTRIYCPHCCPGKCDHPERKKNLLVLDFLWQFKGMGPCRPSVVIAETEEIAQEMNKAQLKGGEVDLLELREIAKANMQAALLKALAAAQRKPDRKKGEYFDAAEWAANLNIRSLIGYEPGTPQEAQAPHPQVLNKLHRAGFVPATVTCEGQARLIERVLDARREAGLATFKQIFWLRRYAVQSPEAWSAEAASKFLDKKFGGPKKKWTPRPATATVR